jgi:predicted transcriptional regulator
LKQITENEYRRKTDEEITVIRMEIIKDIIKARQAKNLSQHELADLCGVPQTVIYRVESGEINPQIETVIKILTPLGMTLAIVPTKQRV